MFQAFPDFFWSIRLFLAFFSEVQKVCHVENVELISKTIRFCKQ